MALLFLSSQKLASVNDKLTLANEEVVMHLREKGEVSSSRIDNIFEKTAFSWHKKFFD